MSNKIKIETQEEKQSLLQILDIASRHTGGEGAQLIAHFWRKVQECKPKK